MMMPDTITSNPDAAAVNGPAQTNQTSPGLGRPTPAKTRNDSATPAARSCVSCRKRKVRCDRSQPCLNCRKAGVVCVSSPSRREKRRDSRSAHDLELMTRLQELENAIGIRQQAGQVVQVSHAESRVSALEGSVQLKSSSSVSPDAIGKDFGRLVMNEGQSQYLSQSFWAVAGGHMDEITADLDPIPTQEDQELLTPEEQTPESFASDGHELVFGSSSGMGDACWIPPPHAQSLALLMIFEQNCDPVLKITHRPTVRNLVFKAASANGCLSRPQEALLISIYYGAVCSLSEKQCQDQLGEGRGKLATQLRLATERALRRANFLQMPCLMTMQALVLFLVILQSQDDTRLVWSLLGMAIHLARSLGMHRDGANFNLSPFETEMRRRLWWRLQLMDYRFADDQGVEPSFTESFYDAQLPLNINDEDISLETRKAPRERTGTTEMTFCLIQFEFSREMCQMKTRHYSAGRKDSNILVKPFAETENDIKQIKNRIEEKYLRHCDTTVPIYSASTTVGRIILAELWLVAYHPHQYSRGDSQDLLGAEARDRLFNCSVEVIERFIILEVNELTEKWMWLFRTYMPWHSIAFVLHELCKNPQRSGHERAWKSVESFYAKRVLHSTTNQKGMLWRALQKLMRKAQTAREKLKPKRDLNSCVQEYMSLDHGVGLDGNVSGKSKLFTSDGLQSQGQLQSHDAMVELGRFDLHEMPSFTGQEDINCQEVMDFQLPEWAQGAFDGEMTSTDAQDFDLMIPTISPDEW